MSAPLLSLEFDTLERQGLRLEGVSARLYGDGAGAYQLDLRVAAITLQEGPQFRKLHIECPLDWQKERLHCADGSLRLAHATLGEIRSRLMFDYDTTAGLRQVRLNGLFAAGVELDMRVTGPGPDWQLQSTVHQADLAVLQPLLEVFGSDANQFGALAGRLSGELALSGWPLTTLDADLNVSELNYSDSSVAQDVTGAIRLHASHEAGEWQTQWRLQLDSGELYIVPPLPAVEDPPGFYIDIASAPVILDAHMGYRSDGGQLIVQDLNYVHPDILRLNLAARMQLAPDVTLQTLALDLRDLDLGRAHPVYLQPWLLNSAFNDLELQGRADIQIGLEASGLTALELQLAGVDIHDPAGRLSVTGLRTALQMTRQRRHDSRVTWDSLDIYRLPLGGGAISLASHDFDIEVTDWRDVSLLDGTLQIAELDLRQVATPEFALDLSGTVQAVSLPALTAALGWPQLNGTLTGDLTDLNYSQGDIRLHGELAVRLFDGHAIISDLAVRDLFGSLPVLTAEVDVADIDLEQLTETFAFGKITGRIGGYIKGLKLENWQPVAFDASLSTLADGNTRHRISQKALNNLSQIGGGLSGALSRGFLRYFDEYSYGELGLSCRLANGYCELGGVARYDGGHYLLTRGGLLPPWVEVKLAGSIIAWDVLIDSFAQMAEGEIKIE